MRRFEFNNENDDDDEFEEEEDGEEMSEELAYMINQDNTDELELQLLHTAIDLARSTFFWRFRRKTTQLKMIGEIYESLYKILEGKENAVLPV